MTTRGLTRALVAAACAVSLLAGCSGGGPGSDARSATTAGPTRAASDAPTPRTLTVLAAASLTEAFTTLAERFEGSHPGVTVRLSFGASSTLAQQALAGAPADVLASADQATMAKVTDAGQAEDPVTFATNSLAIAVPPANPAGITGLIDLARPGVKVALCAPQVPCGAAAQKVFAAASLDVTPVSLEQDVKAVLTKVRLGEVDAGLVYRTDVAAAGNAVTGIAVPEAAGAVNAYPAAVLSQAKEPDLAHEFVALLTGPDGAEVLADAGFARP